MTDTTVNNNAAAQPTPVQVENDFDLDANMAEFFGHSLNAEPSPAPVPEPQGEPVAQPQSPPPVPLNPEPASPAQQPTNAEPAAADPNGGGETSVDQALIAELLIGATPQAAAPQPQPQAQAAPQPQAAAEAPPQGEAFMPLKPVRGIIPAPVLETIFNSEDPVAREDALMGVLTSWGNAIMQMMDDRVRTHHYGQIQQQATQSFAAVQQAQSIEQDFFTHYGDLKPYGSVVQRVAQAVYARQPEAKWSPEVRKQIGDTARELLKKGGINIAAPASPAPAAAQPFVAGSARPAGTGQPQQYDPRSPEFLVEELTDGVFGTGAFTT